jgi:ABC-type polysaccharide/polyol phosphate transport system ATPase subunit
MTVEPVIELSGVSKRFMIRFNPNPSIKSKFVGIFYSRYREKVTPFWALRDIHLRVMPGESVGIMGPNGSGKSTMFKLIAGIMPPTEGVIHTSGVISPLIELGVGFNPELTGKENVFLNTSFYGISRTETEAIFPDILAFSEIGDFINVPIKNYSSGMVMRLAFSIAVHTAPDILLVDEILAVGDAKFSLKCLDWMQAFKESGKTFVLVSHSPDQVIAMCERAVLLWKGRIIAEGPSPGVVEAYSEVNAKGGPDWEGVRKS